MVMGPSGVQMAAVKCRGKIGWSRRAFKAEQGVGPICTGEKIADGLPPSQSRIAPQNHTILKWKAEYLSWHCAVHVAWRPRPAKAATCEPAPRSAFRRVVTFGRSLHPKHVWAPVSKGRASERQMARDKWYIICPLHISQRQPYRKNMTVLLAARTVPGGAGQAGDCN